MGLLPGVENGDDGVIPKSKMTQLQQNQNALKRKHRTSNYQKI